MESVYWVAPCDVRVAGCSWADKDDSLIEAAGRQHCKDGVSIGGDGSGPDHNIAGSCDSLVEEFGLPIFGEDGLRVPYYRALSKPTDVLSTVTGLNGGAEGYFDSSYRADYNPRLSQDDNFDTYITGMPQGPQEAPFVDYELKVGPATITKVEVWARKGSCGRRLFQGTGCGGYAGKTYNKPWEGFNVYVSPEPCSAEGNALCDEVTDAVLCGRVTKANAQSSNTKYTVTCPTPISGRHIIVQQPGSNRYLQFAEIKAYATAAHQDCHSEEDVEVTTAPVRVGVRASS